MSERPAASAGARPNANPVSSAASSVASTAPASSDSSAYGGSVGSASFRSVRSPSSARRSPTAAPDRARSPLSVRSCRTSLPRFAPSATRTASSFRRESVRDSRAPARLAQVIRSTSPALAISTRSGVRVSPTIESRSGTARKLRPRSVSGCSRASSAPSRSISPCAASSPTPGARRPTTPIQCWPRAVAGSSSRGARSSANHRSAPPIGPTKPRGSTPTTSYGSRSMRSVRPTTSGSPPKSRRQASSLSITTWAGPSASASVRPSAARTPSVEKNPPPTSAPDSTRGPARSARVTSKVVKLNAATPVKDRRRPAKSAATPGLTEDRSIGAFSNRAYTRTRRPASAYGSESSSTDFATPKTAALAPIPRARVSTARREKSGVRRAERTPKRRSWRRSSSQSRRATARRSAASSSAHSSRTVSTSPKRSSAAARAAASSIPCAT